MAELVGLYGLHNIENHTCDFCGQVADATKEELNAMDCSYAQCPADAALYHQECLEKYLKSLRLEKNRKLGFACPRGCGKGSRFAMPCPGKIKKSHPIHIRGDAAKKRKAQPPPVLPLVPKGKPKAKDKEAEKAQNNDKAEEAKKQRTALGKILPSTKRADLAKSAVYSALASSTKATLQPVPPDVPIKAKQDVKGTSLAARQRELELLKAPGRIVNGKLMSTKMDADKAPPKPPKLIQDQRLAPPPLNVWATRPSAAIATPHSHVPTGQLLEQPAASPSSTQGSAPADGPSAAWEPTAAWVAVTRQPSAPKGLAVRTGAGAGLAPTPARLAQNNAEMVAASAGTATAAACPRISKAQRKNQKRLEKRAAQRALNGFSDIASSEVVSEMPDAEDARQAPPTEHNAVGQHGTGIKSCSIRQAGAPFELGERESGLGDGLGEVGEHASAVSAAGSQAEDEETEERAACKQALMAAKAQHLLGQLQQLGFAEWQAAPAILRYGTDLESAVSFLLEGNCATEDAARAFMESATCVPDINIDDELRMVADLTALLKLPVEDVERAVALHNGDIDGTAAALYQSFEEGGSPAALLNGAPDTPRSLSNPAPVMEPHTPTRAVDFCGARSWHSCIDEQSLGGDDYAENGNAPGIVDNDLPLVLGAVKVPPYLLPEACVAESRRPVPAQVSETLQDAILAARWPGKKLQH